MQSHSNHHSYHWWTNFVFSWKNLNWELTNQKFWEPLVAKGRNQETSGKLNDIDEEDGGLHDDIEPDLPHKVDFKTDF